MQRCLYLALILLGMTPGVCPADPALTLRKLCIEAPLIVVAQPVNPTTPIAFRVETVLRGKGINPGDVLNPAGLDPARVTTFDEVNQAEGKPRPRLIERALLFLTADPRGTGWKVLPTGFRFCTQDGRLVAPADQANHLTVRPDARWSVVVSRVRDDLASLARLETCRRIARAPQRARALLDWVRERRVDFVCGSEGTDESPVGWDRLQLNIFDWVFACAGPADAWQAIRLFAELNEGELPSLTVPVFSTRTGRAYLLSQLASESALLGDRARAGNLLGERITLWPTPAECKMGAEPLEPAEQAMLVDGLIKLLKVKDAEARASVVRTLTQLSLPASPGRRLDRAFPALVVAYKEASADEARDELALALSRMATPEQWRELTGNPPGVVAFLRDLERKDAALTFWLEIRSGELALCEAPTLVIERLGTLGFIAETKRQPLEVLHLLRAWADGYLGESSFPAQFDISKLAPGNKYRIRVEGFVGRGKDRVKWTSEARKFYLPPQQADRPGGFSTMMKFR